MWHVKKLLEKWKAWRLSKQESSFSGDSHSTAHALQSLKQKKEGPGYDTKSNRTCNRIAGTGVFAVECSPLRTSGSAPSLAATCINLEPTNIEPFAAPNVDDDTKRSTITTPSVPIVYFPKGYNNTKVSDILYYLFF